MEVTLVLCDYAEAVNGKVYIMGGGWNVLWAADLPVNMSIAALVTVPWDQTNQRHAITLELLTDEGEKVEFQEQPVVLSGEFEVGRPPGVKPGTSFNSPFVWNLSGLTLPAGGYDWKLWINKEPQASRPFVVVHRPGAGAQQ
jgi:hypothetical protein